jgi:hypothetical protein
MVMLSEIFHLLIEFSEIYSVFSTLDCHLPSNVAFLKTFVVKYACSI